MITNDINKIFLNGPITVTSVNMTVLAFNNLKAMSKTKYSISDNFVNVVEPIENSLCVYQNVNNTEYYEYYVSLRLNPQIEVDTIDRFGNHFDTLENKTPLIFVDGIKLLTNDYEIKNNSIFIIKPIALNTPNTVIIYLSEDIQYYGNALKSQNWNENTNTFVLPDYSKLDYIFFLNGNLLSYNTIRKVDDELYFSQLFDKNTDILEYYKLPSNTYTVFFSEVNGYFSYGPIDDFGTEVPEYYNSIVTFEKIARLAIDDLRKGFLIKENDTIGNGELIVIDEDYETTSIKCLEIVPFLKTKYNKTEYYVQVPTAKSILKYASEYDLNGTMFPELLGLFQRLLLDETYDSIQRLKNIRSINKVDSVNINALIQFLGMDMKITNLTLEQKHALLEELNSFYKIVGTRSSYNFYNLTGRNTRIASLEQLFTPIKDYSEASDNARRYVTFRTPEELGAVYKKEYTFDHTDYGYVDEIANYDDILTNQPRSEGNLEDNEAGTSIVATDKFTQIYLTPVLNPKRKVYLNNEDGTTTEYEIDVPVNNYVQRPKIGPNEPTIDYGWITEEPVSFIDYGYVRDKIKGHWIQWIEWDRPQNWYPTNHVEVSVEVPSTIDYDTFMKEFMKTFYEIASTVVYIHRLIEEYSFNLVDGGMSIVTTQIQDQLEYTISADPRRQIEGKQIPYPREFYIENPTLTLRNQTVIAGVDFRTVYTNDEEFVDHFEQVIQCTSSSNSNWSITSDVLDYEASEPITELVGGVEKQNDNWSYTIEEYKSTNTITIENNVSTNEWKLYLPNYITFERYGEIYSFEPIDWIVSHADAEITQIDEKDYRFADTLRISALNNSFISAEAYGRIQQNAVIITDVDYIVFRYIWNSGRDLDTDTRITNAYSTALNNKSVGWNRNRAVPTSSGSANSSVLYWGGDNTGVGQESILFNVKYLKDNYYDSIPALLLLELQATWYSSIGAAPTIQVEAYKGGTMQQNGYAFVNVGGEKVVESSVVTTNMSNVTHTYKPVAYVTYNKLTDQVALTLAPIVADYLIFGYRYTNGDHLDTFTRITNSYNSSYNLGVGYYASTEQGRGYPNYQVPKYAAPQDPNSAPAYNPNALMQWCRHNQGKELGKREENVVLNINNFNSSNYSSNFGNEITVDLYCAFLGSVAGLISPNDVVITLRCYRGGNIVQDPNDRYRYINIDDEGNPREPTYSVEIPLENVYIKGILGPIDDSGYTMIPETTNKEDENGNKVKERLLKGLSVTFNRLTNQLTYKVIQK